jgi:hypothetical protein
MTELDGYHLYNLLRHGEAITLTYEEETYTLQFIGESTGANNYLLVTKGTEEKRFGWGWNVEQCFHLINQLERGWNTPQRPPYRKYNSAAEVEGEL